jgi:hypothetical protein
MSKTKLKIRFFTIADYEEEERWLRSQHQNGWKFVKMVPPCFYTFEQCIPEDVIYRLDFKNTGVTGDYMQMYADFGWEYTGHCVNWLYFRKPASQVDGEKEGELFSENESKVDMISHVLKTRMLPIFIMFLCCYLPYTVRTLNENIGAGYLIFWLIMLALYLFLMLHCGLKLLRLKREYKNGN